MTKEELSIRIASESRAWSRIDALKAEAEKMRADAERYRWLRDPCVDIRPIVKYQRGDYGWGLKTHQMLDETIDAAMKETK